MVADLRLLFRAQRLAWLRWPPRPRHLAAVVLFTTLWSAQSVLVAAFRRLDRLVYPGFRHEPVEAPVFIVANPRSGTTFTHRLLALDDEQFTWLALYQTIWPSIAWQRLFDRLARLDGRLGGRLTRGVRRFERAVFGGWDDVHYMGFGRAEEDEGLFTYTLNTPALYLLFPEVDALPEAGVGDALSDRRRRQLMRFYRSSLKRHLYAEGLGRGGRRRTLLSKNTHSSGRIEMLLEAFPDARIIYLVRHPYEAIPSHISMFDLVWRALLPDHRSDGRTAEAYAELAVAYYKKMLAVRERMPPERFIDVRYDELVADPRAVVHRVTDRLGIERGERFERRLAEATAKARTYRSRHSYSLDAFGLSRDWVYERLPELFEIYGFER